VREIGSLSPAPVLLLLRCAAAMVVLVEEGASRGESSRPQPSGPPQPRAPAPLRPCPPASTGRLLRPLPPGRGSPAASAYEPGSAEAGVSIPSGRDLWHFPASGSPSPRSERSASPTFSAEVLRLGFDLSSVGPPPAVAPAPSPALLCRSPPPCQPPLPSRARAPGWRCPASGRGQGGMRSSPPPSPRFPAAASGRWSCWPRRPPGVLHGRCCSLAASSSRSWFATWSSASSTRPACSAAGAPGRSGPCGFGRCHSLDASGGGRVSGG
jgi:hypothetical protein